jgi:UDP-N-acetylmuramoyl-tripeptide--D-alanyl-D-alanine ligase
MTLDVATVLNGTGARVLRCRGDHQSEGAMTLTDLAREFNGVTIDSRSVEEGNLFVAIPGSRVDGHDFVGAAFAAGARGAIVSHVTEFELRDGDVCYLFVVPEPVAALQRLATAWRDCQTAHVVGITGSVGKTTVKDLVAAVLGTCWPVLKSEANLNTEIGLPLMMLRLRSRHRVGVFEMGLHERGDIELLAGLAHAQTAIVTNVYPIHLERMGSIEAIAREKSTLVQALPASGLAILNADDPWTRAMASTSTIARVALCGRSADAAYRADDVESHGLDGMSFTLHAEGTDHRVRARVPGEHAVHALMYAAATARELEMPWPEVIDALESVQLESRQRLIQLAPGLQLIDDRYNASPPSMRAALHLLGSTRGNRIAVLGDMLELGPTEDADHREIGAIVPAAADWLVVRGTRARLIADGAEAAGMAASRIIRTDDNPEAASAVIGIVRDAVPVPRSAPRIRRPTTGRALSDAPTTILVKGSRGMRMEDVVASLREEPWES